MKRIWIIFQKELTDNLRDRRTLITMLFGAIATPILLIALIIIIGGVINVDPEEKILRLPVVGAEYAPGLIAYLQANNIEVVAPPADPIAAVRESQEDIILEILPEYPAAFRKGEPAPLRLIMDSSRTSASASIQRMNRLIGSYNSSIAVLRLQARGIDPYLLAPISTSTKDVATPQSQALIFLNMLPFLLTINVFTGGIGLILDATVGERERGSQEPLLLNPVLRRELVLGKLIASLPPALGSLGLVMLFFYLAFRFIPIEKFIGFPMQLDGSALFFVFLLFIPEVLLASAIQMLVATFSRGVKEAQTYLSFIPIVVGMPGMFLSFIPVKISLMRMAIPTYGQTLLVNQILRGETIPPLHWITATLTTLGLTLLLVVIAIRLYEGERALFGK
jgi:sodium transport system permease protein